MGITSSSAVPLDASRIHSPRGESSLAPSTPASLSGTLDGSLLSHAFSFPVMLATLLIGAVFFVGRKFAVDPDVWWHIKTGDTILSTHRWPITDAYSFTVHGQPWIAGEWLGDVMIALAARLGGLQGLDVLLIVLASAIMLALYGYATLRSQNSKAGFVVAALLFTLAAPQFTLRPQMLGYLFFILTLIALERFRQGKRGAVWLLPALFVMWVNAHGSFVIGIGAIVVYLLSGAFEFRFGSVEARRWTVGERLQLESVLLLSIVALNVTPYGSQLALYPFHVASSLPVGVANVKEWQPIPFNLDTGKIFLALVLFVLLSMAVRRVRLRLEEVVLIVGATVMACLHLRFLLVFVPVVAPGLAIALKEWVPRYDRRRDRSILNAAIVTLVVMGIIHYFPSRLSLEQTIAKKYPVSAVNYLRQHAVPGPMFNSYEFGGYLAWTGQKVFVDGRADPYERGGSLADYFYIMQIRPGALAVLRNYGVQSCLLDRSEPLVTLLSVSTEWHQVYGDNVSVLFARSDANVDKSHSSISMQSRRE